MKRLFLFVLVLLTGCTLHEPAKETVSVHRVIDGDTVELVIAGKVEKVRLLLIDTPESVLPNTPPQPFSKEAEERLERLLTEARTIRVSYEENSRTDKYQRLLAYVFVDEQLVQDVLVKEGYARVAYFKGNEYYYSQLRDSEMVAKKNRKNIWSIDDYVTSSGYTRK